ncbi:hypothetical protein pb186bvf_005792 [Paramecium bursaria]
MLQELDTKAKVEFETIMNSQDYLNVLRLYDNDLDEIDENSRFKLLLDIDLSQHILIENNNQYKYVLQQIKESISNLQILSDTIVKGDSQFGKLLLILLMLNQYIEQMQNHAEQRENLFDSEIRYLLLNYIHHPLTENWDSFIQQLSQF